MRILLAAAMVVAPLTLAPSVASAQSCKAPPGRAAVEQYCESVPGPGGDRGLNAGGKAIRLSPKAMQAREALKRAGSDGQALSRFLTVAPATAAPGTDVNGRGGGTAEPGTSGASGSSNRGSGKDGSTSRAVDIQPAAVPGGLASAVQSSSSSGAGVLLAVGLLGALLALSVAFARRRGSR